MPRRPTYNPFEEHDRQIRRLKDDLYMARVTIVELMKPEARSILESYRGAKTEAEWYQWPDIAAEQIVDLCTEVTERRIDGYLHEERAKCPLCGDGPQSYYDGHAGFKLPEGLRRHLVGYGNTRECAVFGAARALGRDYHESMLSRPATSPNWTAMRKAFDPPG